MHTDSAICQAMTVYRRAMKAAQAGSRVVGASPPMIRIGTAGWALPKAMRGPESADKPVLQQYAQLFDVVEINSSFYRPHQLATYERWRAGVPDSFRFSVKVPRTITHELGLSRCQSEIIAFMECARGLEHKLGVLLVQLPPSGAFDAPVATAFFAALRRETTAQIACEARNPSWFDDDATAVLAEHRVTRVTADPVPSGCEFAPPVDPSFAYFRLHGSPRMYYSSYTTSYLREVAAAARAATQSWCVFDNTAAGAAWLDAATMRGFTEIITPS
jgi:uncharacterized protein YecE (DUF72 family)